MGLLEILSVVDGKVLLIAATGAALHVGRLIATSPAQEDTNV